MADKARFDPEGFDLDAELAALAEAGRRAAPEVSDALRARVLADASDIAALRAAAPGAARAQRARQLRRTRGEPRFRLFGLLDAWGKAAVAAAAVCFVIGLGVGYGAGDQVLAEAGFASVDLARAGGNDESYLLLEDVL